MILAASKKFATTQAQMSMIALFIVFSHEDHYITSFIPGRAFLMIFLSFVFLPLLALLSFVFLPCLCIFAVYLAVVACGVCLPLTFGYTWFTLNYAWNVGSIPCYLFFGAHAFEVFLEALLVTLE